MTQPLTPAPRAVIFDCDGTLVDSETSGMTAVWQEARKIGYSQPLERALLDFRGRKLALCADIVEADTGRPVPADFVARARAAMTASLHGGVAEITGAAALLAALRAAAVPYAIASNGPQDKMELTLGLAGLAGFFEKHVFSAYDVGHWKPAPGLFLHAAEELGVAAGDCVVVEDSLPGIEAGLAAGMRVYSLCEPALVPAAIAARITRIEGLAELHEAFGLPA